MRQVERGTGGPADILGAAGEVTQCMKGMREPDTGKINNLRPKPIGVGVGPFKQVFVCIRATMVQKTGKIAVFTDIIGGIKHVGPCEKGRAVARPVEEVVLLFTFQGAHAPD